MSNEEKRFYTPEEAAEILQITVYTCREWLRAGKLGAVKIGRSWRIPAMAFDELEWRAVNSVVGKTDVEEAVRASATATGATARAKKARKRTQSATKQAGEEKPKPTGNRKPKSKQTSAENVGDESDPFADE